ncbi:MAG: hypothetical protein GX890_05050 [Firmicutes bacterium]|jgi:hypothetical protein|nr:hypothetical protein [Bacillota bacterium]HPU01711.1 DUF6063 family protein [Bacillota bacterium]
MQYSRKTVETALELLKELLQHPVVERATHEDLVNRVRFDSEVRNLWREIIEPLFEISLISAGDQFYLAGSLTGGIFSYRNEELRDLLGVQTNRELYLCSFIVLTLLAAFYDSDDGIGPSRESLLVSELAEMVTTHLQELGSSPDVEELENQTRVNLRGPAELWLDLPYQKVDVVHIRRSDCRLAYLLKTIDLLQKHGLVRLIHDRQIFPCERLNQLIAHYYNQQSRKNEILEMLRSRLHPDSSPEEE